MTAFSSQTNFPSQYKKENTRNNFSKIRPTCRPVNTISFLLSNPFVVYISLNGGKKRCRTIILLYSYNNRVIQYDGYQLLNNLRLSVTGKLRLTCGYDQPAYWFWFPYSAVRCLQSCKLFDSPLDYIGVESQASLPACFV